MKLEVHGGHLVAHHAEGGMKASEMLTDVNVRQPKKPSGHPAMACIFGQSVFSRPTSFVIALGRMRNLDHAVPALQVCFDDTVNRSSGAVPEWDGGGIKREH